MPVVLIILLVAAVALTAAAWCHITADIHYKENKLSVVIKGWFIRKKIDFDFTEEKSAVKSDASDSVQKKSSPIAEKLKSMKERIFTDSGIDTKEAETVKNEIVDLYNGTNSFVRTFFKRLRFKLHVPKLMIKLDYGTGDPADTGMLYGAIWGAVGVLYPVAARYAHINYPTLYITPDFYGKRFDAEIRSIIKVRPAHIINALFSALIGLAITYFNNKTKKGSGKDGR